MIKLAILCEGPTELRVVNTLLAPHFLCRGVEVTPILWGGGGGSIGWERFQSDVKDAFVSHDVVSTFADLVKISHPMQERSRCREASNPYDAAARLEKAMQDSVEELRFKKRFIPFVMIHEVEALVFVSPGVIQSNPNKRDKVQALTNSMRDNPGKWPDCPEEINGGEATHPSKRLESHFGNWTKPSDTVKAVQAIGLAACREKCPHFHAWVTQLESLSTK